MGTVPSAVIARGVLRLAATDEAGESDGGEQFDGHQGLLSLRRERVLQLPAPSCTFAQSFRQVPGEQRVVRTVEKHKVVETVKKEVESYMSSGAATLNFGRADYQRITDQVEAILARRLKIHRERLGLN